MLASRKRWMNLIVVKLILTILIVTGLSIITERAGPRLAGILSGFPIGSALTLTFIGLEQGPQFEAESALHNAAGMLAMLCLLLTYARVSRRTNVWLTPFLSVLVFLAGAALLRWLNLPTFVSVVLSAASILLFQRLFRGLPDQPIIDRVHLGAGVLLFRAVVSAGAVLLVTGVAGAVGPAWAGLFTSFPVTVFPLLIVLQHTYGPEPGQGVIKNIPRGLWAVLAFTLTTAWANPRIGLGWGTLLALSAALAALALALKGNGFHNHAERSANYANLRE